MEIVVAAQSSAQQKSCQVRSASHQQICRCRSSSPWGAAVGIGLDEDQRHLPFPHCRRACHRRRPRRARCRPRRALRRLRRRRAHRRRRRRRRRHCLMSFHTRLLILDDSDV